jgi:SM-20-related protein
MNRLDLNQTPIVFDLFFPNEFFQNICSLTRRPIWAFGWKSITKSDDFAFWHAHFAGGEEDSEQDCEDELRKHAWTKPVLEMWEFLKQMLHGHSLVRAYANGSTFGNEGYVHTDSKTEHNYTFVYYAHSQWKSNWGGELVIYSKTADEVLACVEPKPGRLVVFPGNLPHVARGPSRICPALRVSIVFKTRLLA